MAQGDIETYYEDGMWKNKREGMDRAFGAGYGTKDEAVAEGRDAAQRDKVEHVVKNQDGQIGARNSYGNDPRNIPGRRPRPGPCLPAGSKYAEPGRYGLNGRECEKCFAVFRGVVGPHGCPERYLGLQRTENRMPS